MSLFEKIKNIRRSNLQEKKIKFPGGTGDIGFTAPKRGEKVQKRLDRADKLGTPDPFDPDYDKKVKKVDGRTKIGKAFQTPKKSDLKKLDKQPGGYRAPKSDFGPGITKGQANVKDMQRRAFKITQPSDINDPTKKRFDQLSKEIKKYKSDVQDFKDRNLPGGPRKTSRTSFKGQGSGSRFDPGIGMAPPNTPKKTKPQKGVSAIETTKKYNQEKNLKKFQKFRKEAETATTNLRKQVDTIAKNPKLTGSQKAEQSRKVMKDVKTAQNFARGLSDPKKAQTAITVPKDIKTVQSAAKGAITEPKPPKFSTGITKSGNISFAKDPTKLGGMKLNKTTQAIVKRETSKRLRRPENVKYAVASAKRTGLARGATRLVGMLGPKGRLAATVIGGAGSVAAINPGVRKFIRNAAIGTGIAATLGFGKKEKVLKKGDGLKTVGKVNVRYGLTGSKTNKDGKIVKSGGKIYDPKQMAQLGKVQKNFIDKYNKKASRNPFKKQIQYKPKADGTYKVLDPKK